ncbi:MAG: histidinol dehydrogenase [Deltaproteobacteria bacterium]|jgi:histidinol dehydrogenase|nr:histidinol dehydrogenase [Deltaproteobacteria bacterium]MBT4266285.1 histidinol dehydrogenase [Deltaproteobacteria bacterium]MBT4639995.1 histidinol dehydrogenase [Deltaproteobacteria bacterium]MBT6503827.1 histidinol dehydrogenase [Deltaproteobacteria bacterium]MBT7152372.1 histidinol dehydrogenase [Deltaproteobacteria bacterium]
MSLIEIVHHRDCPLDDLIKAPVDQTLTQLVSKIIKRVIEFGDQALLDYTKQFDGVQINSVTVPIEKLRDAEKRITSETRQIIEQAVQNIRRFHQLQLSKSWEKKEDDGTVLGEIVRPLDRVGIYIPGGKAFYPSSLIMNAVPAQIAEVPSIMIVSPPGEDGFPHHLVLGICSMLGIEEVHGVGGAQAIAAMAYGTETIAPAFKITGPGNRFVAEAKRQVFGKVGIDSVAGPSEILILHDDQSVPSEFIVRDLLTQAEHDEEARSLLITTQKQTALEVQKRIDELVPSLPRNEIIRKSFQGKGKIILVDTIDDGIDIVNTIAPEHLEVLISDESKLERIRNAGAIFVGKWSTETVGDYFAGPNHTIPTGGAAKYGSPLSVRDFQKHSSLIKYSENRLSLEGETIARFAELEDLHAHAAAVRARLKKD